MSSQPRMGNYCCYIYFATSQTNVGQYKDIGEPRVTRLLFVGCTEKRRSSEIREVSHMFSAGTQALMNKGEHDLNSRDFLHCEYSIM